MGWFYRGRHNLPLSLALIPQPQERQRLKDKLQSWPQNHLHLVAGICGLYLERGALGNAESKCASK